MTERVRSYLAAVSPSVQYADLNQSLEAYVVDTRKNLLNYLNLPEDDIPENLIEAPVGEETLKVFLRVRPFTQTEMEKGEDKQCFVVKDEKSICTKAPSESSSYRSAQHFGADRNSSEFSFTHVFDQKADQVKLFDVAAFNLARDFVLGRNVLLFSYGVTNAGKTYTIQGTESQPGIIPRTLMFLFQCVREQMYQEPTFKPKYSNDAAVADEVYQKKMLEKKEIILKFTDISDFEEAFNETNLTKIPSSSESSITSACSSQSDDVRSNCDEEEIRPSVQFTGSRYLIWVSFAEIYNEYIYDLLEMLPAGPNKRRKSLKLSEDKKMSVYVKDLTEICVTSFDEALKVLAFGQNNLRFAATKLNYNSSRSHCIYTIRLMRLVAKEDKLLVERTSKFSFCDLAGSERTSKTGSTGERLKEAGSINTSLLNLGRCINTLRYNQNLKPREKAQIIPFRDSKLTRLFQSFLTGRGKACMIVNISPCAGSFDETLQVLLFSSIAKLVRQLSTDNLDSTTASAYLSLKKEEPKKPETNTIKKEPTLHKNGATPFKEDADQDETICDQGYVERLLEVIDDLKSELLEERKKNFRIEYRIREELCTKFAAQFSEMNRQNARSTEEQLERAEDFADERLELYIQTVKKMQNKNERRVTMAGTEEGEEEQAWVPEKVLQAEQKEKELLKAELEALKKKESTSGNNVAGSSTAALEEQIAQKKSEVEELEKMLDEAGQTFKSNKAEIVGLKSTVDELNSKVHRLTDELKKKDARVVFVEGLLLANNVARRKTEDQQAQSSSTATVNNQNILASIDSNKKTNQVQKSTKRHLNGDDIINHQTVTKCGKFVNLRQNLNDNNINLLPDVNKEGRHESTSIEDRDGGFACETLPISPIKRASPTPPKICLNDVTLMKTPLALALVRQHRLSPIEDSPAACASRSTAKKTKNENGEFLIPSSVNRPVTRSVKKKFFPAVSTSNSSSARQTSEVNIKSINNDDVIVAASPPIGFPVTGSKKRRVIDIHGNRAFELRVKASPSASAHCHTDKAVAASSPRPSRPVTRFFKQLTGAKRKSIALKRLSNAKRLSVAGHKKK